jgi:HD-GYP domain-containing protein (c-di-GMP phosphodiesterase class II)
MKKRNSFPYARKYQTLISANHAIYRLVNSTYELKDLIPRLARLICQIFNSQFCLITLLDPSKEYSLLRCIVIGKEKYVFDKRMKISGRIEKRIINKGAMVKEEHLLGIPLICEDVAGVIIVKRDKKEAIFDRFDQEMLMTMGEQAIIGVKTMQLYDEQQKIVLGSIKSLVTLLDTRVPQEYTHSPYFSNLVVMLANQMHLDEKQTESLKYASMLHDAGKVDIPMQILTKTSKLTPHEYRIIKRHPVAGAQILRHLQVLRPAIPIIMHHHEKYNGTGYPSRLKKGQIPLGARIMSVADAFEAMVYGRPYRERMDIPSAVKEIKKKSGTQFDPRIVEAFMKVVKKIKTKKYLPGGDKRL